MHRAQLHLATALRRKRREAFALILIAALALRAVLAQARPAGIGIFVAQLREFDLNPHKQKGYALTAGEYRTLLATWQALSLSDRVALLQGAVAEWEAAFFVEALLLDLSSGVAWKAHAQRMLALGARDLSLTLSTARTRVRVHEARAMLVDLLQADAPMLRHDSLLLPEAFKAEAARRAGKHARNKMEEWQRLIARLRPRPTWEQLTQVNEFFNRSINLRYDEGTEHGCDYWQSPLETLARGAGDCDDFAMAKYVTLRLLGIPVAQLRVAIVMQPCGSGHAVLLFFPLGEDDAFVLDNLLTASHGVVCKSEILRLSQRVRLHGLRPAFGINEQCWSVFEGGAGEIKQAGDPCRKFRKFAVALRHSHSVLPPAG